MNTKRKPIRTVLLVLLGVVVPILGVGLFAGSGLPNPLMTLDGNGILSTYNTSGPIDVTNPFFQNLGTNGRTCNSCHVSSEAWTVSPHGIRERFEATRGTTPSSVRWTGRTVPAQMYPRCRRGVPPTACC